VSFLEAMSREPGLTRDDVLLAVTTLSFDIAGLEMWLPMMAGAQTVIAASGDALDGARMIELVEKHGKKLASCHRINARLVMAMRSRSPPCAASVLCH
jgi:non-ribosomal peptide synthetase component F